VTDGTTDREADDGLPRWRDPAWRAEILSWAVDRLAIEGLRPTGQPEQVKARPWSTVFRLPTAAGPTWLKANAAGSRYEASLVSALARWAPDQVVPPVAVEPAEGWLLMRDGGPTLQSVLASSGRGGDLAAWERLLVEHAQLQRIVETQVPELLSLGVPDNRPHVLPALREDLLSGHSALRLGQDGGPSNEEHEALRKMGRALAGACAALDALGVPDSIEHDDLHDNNVFAPKRPGQPMRVFDWGDAVVGQPFMVLHVLLGTVAEVAQLADGAPQLLRLRDAYLDAWTDVASLDDLKEGARLANRAVGVVRAASWRRALCEATLAGRARWEDRIVGWLGQEPAYVLERAL